MYIFAPYNLIMCCMVKKWIEPYGDSEGRKKEYHYSHLNIIIKILTGHQSEETSFALSS